LRKKDEKVLTDLVSKRVAKPLLHGDMPVHSFEVYGIISLSPPLAEPFRLSLLHTLNSIPCHVCRSNVNTSAFFRDFFKIYFSYKKGKLQLSHRHHNFCLLSQEVDPCFTRKTSRGKRKSIA
jgi:hypothetical protein